MGRPFTWMSSGFALIVAVLGLFANDVTIVVKRDNTESEPVQRKRVQELPAQPVIQDERSNPIHRSSPVFHPESSEVLQERSARQAYPPEHVDWRHRHTQERGWHHHNERGSAHSGALPHSGW